MACLTEPLCDGIMHFLRISYRSKRIQADDRIIFNEFCRFPGIYDLKYDGYSLILCPDDLSYPGSAAR